MLKKTKGEYFNMQIAGHQNRIKFNNLREGILKAEIMVTIIIAKRRHISTK